MQYHNIAIRARVRADLERLLDLPTELRAAQLSILEIPNRDYPYRIYVSQDELGQLMECIAMDVDYSNFKSMIDIAPGQGPHRHELYMQVWSVMHRAEDKLHAMAERAAAHVAKMPWWDLPAAPKKAARKANKRA